MSEKTNERSVWRLLKQSANDWMEDKAPRLGAALAYYAVFSLAPLLVIAIAIAGIAFGADAASGAVNQQLRDLLGRSGAQTVEEMIAAAQQPSRGIIATAVGIIALLFGAMGVFGQLQDSLNTIWEVQPKPGRGIWGAIKDRLFSLTMVLGTGFLLLTSLVLSAALAAVGKWMQGVLPGPEWLVHIAGIATSFFIITLLFALIFKYVPDAEIAWKDVAIGAVVTAALFTIGKYVLGLYLGRTDAASAYGSAGSLIIVLLWVYYSSQILFMGAEFTQAYAHMYGSRVRPAPHAVAVTEEQRAEEGMASGRRAAG